MLKPLIVIFFTFLFQANLFSQEKMVIKGLVFKQGSAQKLSGVHIENKSNKTFYESDQWGNFTINAALHDTLLFQKEGFQEIEKVILEKQNLLIYMPTAVVLQEVVVKEKTMKQEQKEILDGYRSKGVFFNGKPPLLVYFFNPLTALNELLGKDANNAKRFGNYVARENAETTVDAHFNEGIIKKTVAIKDSEMVEFMYLYRPKPNEVTYRNYYDDMAYIKKSYLLYLKNKR